MEYHSDRFEDYSLLIFKRDLLIAILPANRKGNTLYSHQGLSYGGFVFSKKIKFNDALFIFKETLAFLHAEGITKFHLKALPKIYHKLPSDEIDYLLFITQAKLVRTDVSSTIDLRFTPKIQPNRMEGVKKAEKNGLTMEEGSNFKDFWNTILMPNLKEKHNIKPVHTLEEIESLGAKFPKHIIQFNVLNGKSIVAGATMFESENVAHVQYISADTDKQQLGSLDFLFHELIINRFSHKKYFDFGISNINEGTNINEGLLYWKESFGARTTVQQFFEINTSKYSKLDKVFI